MQLLIEIGLEELPAAPLLKSLEQIKTSWQNTLKEAHLLSEFDFFYTPRRLVLHHKNFPSQQEDSFVEFIGAPKEIAFQNDVLSPAGASFLQKTGLSEKELEFKIIKGKEVLYHQKEIKGKKSEELLPSLIEKWLTGLNFGKTMRWGKGEFSFIRPLRNLICLLDDKSVEFELFGIKSAKRAFVHRSVSYEALEFKDIAGYFKLLSENFIILDQEQRKQRILTQMQSLASKQGIQIADDEELLAEVVAITEYPTALLGSFDETYLQIPSEVIITSMRENQRYFAVFKEDNLTNHFIVVANAVCEDFAKIINGNERVLRARLADAKFFYENDLKTGLEPEKLQKMSYLDGLGSIYDKVQREKQIALLLCELYQNEKKEQIAEAITLSKADLATQMVYEFGNLQGIMGSYYAKNMGKSYEICLAIKEQYLPNADKAPLPSTEFSGIVALANKIDTLMGLFSLGKIPSGTKDPYALRRAALGLIKIVLQIHKNFKLKALLEQLKPLYKDFDTQILLDFIYERLYTLYEVNASFVKAVLSVQDEDIIRIDESVKALILLSKDKEFDEKFATFKRLANIAVKNDFAINEAKFMQDEEKGLFEAFQKCDLSSNPRKLLYELFALKEPIDAFFDKVMINDKDEALRQNRQALIYQIYKAFLSVADIKELSI